MIPWRVAGRQGTDLMSKKRGMMKAPPPLLRPPAPRLTFLPSLGLQSTGEFGATTASGFGLPNDGSPSRGGSSLQSLGSQGYTPLTGTPAYNPSGPDDDTFAPEDLLSRTAVGGSQLRPACDQPELRGLDRIDIGAWSGESPPNWGPRGRWGMATPEWGNTRTHIGAPSVIWEVSRRLTLFSRRLALC